ncbi:MAG: hypothetical protein M2R45_01220 [Verrucomicrobia subdivision 3 bacterium]|nr:hypothetical protein [Limisphaerales bacterium]MCS1415228.1 hypothetical protein [Limisphaerales bacterium]
MAKIVDLPALAPGIRQNLAAYLAMIRNVDTNMGCLDDFLRCEQLWDNAVLIFAMGNGSTFVDQQGQIRRGICKNGYWHLESLRLESMSSSCVVGLGKRKRRL